MNVYAAVGKLFGKHWDIKTIAVKSCQIGIGKDLSQFRCLVSKGWAIFYIIVGNAMNRRTFLRDVNTWIKTYRLGTLASIRFKADIAEFHNVVFANRQTGGLEIEENEWSLEFKLHDLILSLLLALA